MRYLAMGPTNNTRYLGAALTPPLSRWHATVSRGMVVGHPGTLRVASPPPSAVPQHPGFLSNTGRHRSSDAPDFRLPAIYYEAGNGYGDHEHAPVSRISDNQMPVPARRPANVILSNQYRARLGGQRQIVQPQVVQTWRGMYGNTGG